MSNVFDPRFFGEAGFSKRSTFVSDGLKTASMLNVLETTASLSRWPASMPSQNAAETHKALIQVPVQVPVQVPEKSILDALSLFGGSQAAAGAPIPTSAPQSIPSATPAA